MKLGFQYGTRYIDFNVVYRDRKTMTIEVEPSGDVNVISPISATEEVILKKVKSKAKWIVQKQYEVKNVNVNKIRRETVNGESYLYLGRTYSLQVILDEKVKDINVRLLRGKFIVTTYTKDQDKIKLALENWYRDKTLKKVKERVKYYESYFKDKVTDIKVKDQKKRWASCTKNNELLFNWRCVMAPSNILDYIVVHEMCHMKYKSHSKEFWDNVCSVLIDYEYRKEWLKNNGIKLDL
jgi:predicted metal-dependent hydrolase